MKAKHSFRYALIVLITTVSMMLVITLLAAPASANTNSNNESKRAVPFSEVNVDEGFMHNYIKLVICQVIPTAISNVEQDSGGIPNIYNCAKWHDEGSDPAKRPAPQGAKYVDSDVHKVFESMCMALDTPDNGDQEIIAAQAKIKEKLDTWIPWYVSAQEKEGSQYPGYLDTFYSLTPTKAQDPEKGYNKYSNTDNHELYCQGHFIEAAVAHYRYAKVKDPENATKLLDVAIKSANHIVNTFGPKSIEKRIQIPGHEEIELALVKLAKLCKEINTSPYVDKADDYIDRAAFFLEARGHDYESRTADDVILKSRKYDQDHEWVYKQDEAVGHAVRAQYLYTGMCELASVDPYYAQRYNTALNSLWKSLTNTKQYITGGVGDSVNNDEGLNKPYVLGNYSAYCETCAGVANMLWNRSMSTFYDGSQYADQVETDLYNNVLGCINFDGNKFYYENRICTKDAFDRSTWFGTACCPPNYTRTILQLGGYIYNTTSSDIYVNQFISNKAAFDLASNKRVEIDMQSGFPYETNGSIVVTPKSAGDFNVRLRAPSWAKTCTVTVDGATVSSTPVDGYIVIDGLKWTPNVSKTIQFNFDKELKYIKTDPQVETNEGLIALRHGPLYYCAEGCDNDANFNFNKAAISQGANYTSQKIDLLDGKVDHYGNRAVYVLNHPGKVATQSSQDDITWRLIPYYARCNRELGSMHLFFHDGEKAFKTHQKATPAASFTSKERYDSLAGLNDGENTDEMRWTSWNGQMDNPEKNPWVEYSFDNPVKIKGFRIWWYDDQGGVQKPDNWTFSVYKKQNNSTEEIDPHTADGFTITNDDKYETVLFPQNYEGDLIKLMMDNSKINRASGIVEWELIDADEPVPPGPSPDPSPDPVGNGDPIDGYYDNPPTGDNPYAIMFGVLILFVAITILSVSKLNTYRKIDKV